MVGSTIFTSANDRTVKPYYEKLDFFIYLTLTRKNKSRQPFSLKSTDPFQNPHLEKRIMMSTDACSMILHVKQNVLFSVCSMCRITRIKGSPQHINKRDNLELTKLCFQIVLSLTCTRKCCILGANSFDSTHPYIVLHYLRLK